MEKYQNRKYKFQIGDIVKNILITSCTRHLKERAYTGICQVCGEEGVYLERSLIKNNVPCHVCNGKNVKTGFNDLATTSPWMVEYFVNKDEAAKYQEHSSAIVLMKCPYCGIEKKTYIHSLKSHGHISCKCKDKNRMSFPEIMFDNMMSQLGIEIVYQATSLVLPWARRYKYDFYFTYNSQSYIVEINGMQHYQENHIWRVSLEEQQKTDKNKEILANEYIDHYIVIDCRYSRINYFKNAVLDSQLPHLLNFDENSIDWDACRVQKPRQNNQTKHKRMNDQNLKKSVLDYLRNTDNANYREMCGLFHSGYRRLRRIICELISENRIASDIITTRNMNKAEVVL